MLGFLIPFNINTMSIFSFSLDLCIKGELPGSRDLESCTRGFCIFVYPFYHFLSFVCKEGRSFHHFCALLDQNYSVAGRLVQ